MGTIHGSTLTQWTSGMRTLRLTTDNLSKCNDKGNLLQLARERCSRLKNEIKNGDQRVTGARQVRRLIFTPEDPFFTPEDPFFTPEDPFFTLEKILFTIKVGYNVSLCDRKKLVPSVCMSSSTGHGNIHFRLKWLTFADVIKLRSGSGEILLDELRGCGMGVSVFTGVFNGWQEGLGYKVLWCLFIKDGG